MSKLLASCALAGALVLMVSQDASARWRRHRYWAPTYQYYYTPAPAVPAATVPPVARNGTGYSYRSFSYDAAGAPFVAPSAAPVYRYQQPLAPSQSHFFRADRKLHGLSWYRTE